MSRFCGTIFVMSLLQKVLDSLAAPFTEGQLTIGEIIYHPYKMIYGDLNKIYRQNTIYKGVKRAEQDGYLTRKKIKENTYLALTQLGEGKLKKLKNKLDFDIQADNKEWDGKYRLVFFDIPEKDRSARDLLRNKLKEFGFLGWQKSVMVSRQDVTKELREFFEKAGLKDYVLVIETEDLGNRKLEYLLTFK